MEEQKVNYAETNPKEIVTVFSGPENNKTGLMVESYFDKADPEKKCAPQQIYHDGFSRFKFYLVSKKSSKTANLPVSDFAEIEARTQFIRQKMYEMELNHIPAAEEQLSPAYTQRMPTGEFKGKTPAQILLESSENQEKLNQQYQWLKSNLAAHPNNKQLMDAIMDAAALFKAGKLKNVAQQGTVFNSYTPGFRPLTRKKRDDGMCFVYEMSIRCFMNNTKSPIEISISNYFAPFVIRENGTINVQVSGMNKETLMKGTINLSMKDWSNVMEKMREQKDAYIIMFAKDRFAEASRLYEENQRKNQSYAPEAPEA